MVIACFEHFCPNARSVVQFINGAFVQPCEKLTWRSKQLELSYLKGVASSFLFMPFERLNLSLLPFLPLPILGVVDPKHQLVSLSNCGDAQMPQKHVPNGESHVFQTNF